MVPVISFSFLSIILRKYFIKSYLPLLASLALLSIYWLFIGGDFIEILYTFLFVLFAILVMLVVKRISSLKLLIVNFYFFLVVFLAAIAVVSFFAYNFELLPYSLTPLGDGDDTYQYYHNYLLGYVNPKIFDFGPVGRVTTFLFEPSYLGWFFTTNLLLVHLWVRKFGPRLLIQTLVLLAALSTFSTMCWIVLGIVLISFIVFKGVELILTKKILVNIISSIILLSGLVIFFSIVGQDKFFESLGPSSSDDRNDRIETSMLYLATGSTAQLFLGRGPGYIGLHSDKGESNPIVKLLVEEGIILTVLIILFVVNCTYRNKYYMIATILWLNSVVILFTPLFILNLLVSKWMMDIDKDGTSLGKAELTENLIEN